MKVKFAHVSDCHLGCWRKESLNQVGYEAFSQMVEYIIKENVDFVLISGDLYDVSNPKVDVIDLATKELKKLSDANIPVYGIMGSHDFSPSDKSMVRPLISAELFKNVSEPNWIPDANYPLQLKLFEDQKTSIKITGMRARKKGLELENYHQLDKENLEKEPGPKIFVLHTMISELKPKEFANMTSGEKSLLPRNFLYYAAGHMHKTLPEQLRDRVYHIKKDSPLQDKIVYPGSLYPTNFQELEKFQYGGFCIVEGDISKGELEVEYIPLKIREVRRLSVDADNKSISQVKDIIEQEIRRGGFEDKVVVIRIKGSLSSGKSYEIKANEIRETLIEDGAYEILINKAQLISEEYTHVHIDDSETREQIEMRLIYEHAQKANVYGYSKEKIELMINQVLTALGRDQNEGEKVKDYDYEMVETFYAILGLNDVEGET